MSDAEDWGELLFEPPLKRVVYAGNPVYVLTVGLTLLVAFILPTIIYLAWDDMPRSSKLSLGITTGMYDVVGLWFLHKVGTNRPFRIFSRGITATRVPFGQGFAKKDRFIPFNRVERIVVDDRDHRGWIHPGSLIIQYLDEGGRGEARIRWRDVEPRGAFMMELLRRYIPDHVEVRSNQWWR